MSKMGNMIVWHTEKNPPKHTDTWFLTVASLALQGVQFAKVGVKVSPCRIWSFLLHKWRMVFIKGRWYQPHSLLRLLEWQEPLPKF